MGLLNDCPRCYEQTINQCVDQLIFVLGLTAGETYFFTFTDNHNKQHIVEVVADSDGNATIDVADSLPEGFFIVYSGSKVVTWKQSGCEDLCFTPCDGETEYCCITLFPVDRSGDFEDVVIETIPCCEETPAVEEIVFANVLFMCEDAEEATVSGNFTVENGSGNYAFQIFRDETWHTVVSSIAPPSFSTAGPTATEATYQTRIIDTTTIVVSNELPLVIYKCTETETLILNSIGTFQCDIASGQLLVEVDFDATNPLGQLMLQRLIVGVWTDVVEVFNGQSNYLLPAIVSGIGFTDFRVLDSTSGVVSNTYSTSVPNCIMSSLTLLQVGNVGSSGASTTISIDYSAVNIYELVNGNKDLIIQYSADGLTNWQNNQTLVMSSSPFTGHPPVSNHTSPVYAPLVYVRLYGNDFNGVPVYSNALPIPP